MDRIRQTAKALCCWGTVAPPSASSDSSSGRGSAAPLLSSTTLLPAPASTASGRVRRQQIIENRGAELPTATTGEVVLAAVNIPQSNSRESEDRPASFAATIRQSAAHHDVLSVLFALSPEETARSNVAPQPQPGTHESTPSSLAYSEFSNASLSSNDLRSQLRGLRLIEPPTSAASSLSGRYLPVSQRSAFAPFNRGDHRVGLMEDVAGNSILTELSRSSAAVTAVRLGQYVPPGHSGVVTWLNLFEEIPEHTEYAGSHHPPASTVPQGGIALTIPEANVASASPGYGATDQEDAVTLPLMPLLRDTDRASRPLAMLRRQHMPDEDDTPHFLSFEQGHWPSAPVAPAALPRSNEGEGLSSASTNTSGSSSASGSSSTSASASTSTSTGSNK